MALPAFNNGTVPLSLNQIHLEAGGTSGTSVTLNDSDIRGLTAAADQTISTTSQTAISFRNLFGASGSPTDVETLTAGFQQVVTGTRDNPNQFYTNYYGYMHDMTPTSDSGTLVDGEFSFKNNNDIIAFYMTRSTASVGLNHMLTLRVSGLHTNSGWTNLVITRQNNTYSFTRSSAGFFAPSNSSFTQWRWDLGGTSSLFTVEDGVYTCTFS